jgi:hypothetical protein
MENKEGNIEDLFRERFENDEAPVSPMVWQNIKKTLPEDKKSLGFTFSTNTILWSIAGILMLSAVIGSYLHFYQNKSSAEAFHTSQQANPTSYSNSVDEKSTEVRSNDDSLSIAGPHQDRIEKSSHNNIQAIQSKPFSSVNHPKDKNATSVTSVRASHSNSTFLKKDNQITIRKTIVSSDDQNQNTKKYQQGKHSASDALTVASSYRPLAQKTSDGVHNNKYSSSDDKDNADKDMDQTIQSSSSLAQKKEKPTSKNSLTQNLPVSSVKDSATTASKQKEITDKNGPTLQTDATQLPSIHASTDSDNHTGVSDSDFISISISQDSINKVQADAIAKNNVRLESADTISTVDHKKGLATDSMPVLTKQETLSEHAVLYSSASLDSSSLNQTISSDHFLSKDSVSEIKAPPLIAQDSLLVKMDSLQAVQPDSVLAKTTDKKAKSNLLSRLSFDLVATALFTGAKTSTHSTDSSFQATLEDKNKNDKNSLGYSAGVIANYKVSERIRASVGITYTNFSEHYHFTYTLKQSYWVFVDTTWQQVEYDSIHRDFKVKDQYSFLSIPLQLSYTFLQKGNLKLSAAVGLRSNILIKGVTYIANAQKNDVMKVTSGFNKISFMYQLSLEAAYQCNKHMALLVQPVFVYGATSLHNKASSLQQKPYGAGVTIGLRFTF